MANIASCILKLVMQMRKGGVRISDADVRDLAQIALKDPSNLRGAFREAIKRSNPEYSGKVAKLTEMARANLLGGTRIPAMKLVADTTVQLANAAVDEIQARLPGALKGNKETGMGRARLSGMLDGFGKGLQNARESLSRGSMDLTQIAEDPHIISQLGAWGESGIDNAWGIPRKAIDVAKMPLRAFSEFIKPMVQSSNLYSEAYRIAKSEGRSGPGIEARMNEIIGDPAKVGGLPDRLAKMVDHDLFLDPLESGQAKDRKLTGIGGMLEHGAAWIGQETNRNPMMMLAARMVKVPFNFAKMQAGFTPAAWPDAYKAISDYRAGRITDSAAGEVVAKQIVGMSVLASSMTAAANGLITGAGPADPKQRKLLEDQGWKPYAVHVPGTQIYYQLKHTPVSAAIGFGADAWEIARDKAEGIDKWSDTGKRVADSIWQNLGNALYVKQLGDFYQALHDPGKELPRWAARSAGSLLVNAGVAQIAKAIDPVKRDATSSWVAPVASRLPFLSQTVSPERSATGEPVLESPGGSVLSRVASAAGFPVSVAAPTKLASTMLKIGYTPGDVPKQIKAPALRGGEMPLADQDRQALEDAKAKASERMESLVSNPGFQRLPAAVQKAQIEARYKAAETQAIQSLYRSPEFRERLAKQRQALIAASRGPQPQRENYLGG